MIKNENTRSTSLCQTQTETGAIYKKPYPSPKKAAIELIRDVALHRRAVHMTGNSFRIVVRLREMHDAAVVPEHGVSFCPLPTLNEGVGRYVRIERVEKIGTFLLVHIDHVFEDLSTEIGSAFRRSRDGCG